jgi:hypothetical protein
MGIEFAEAFNLISVMTRGKRRGSAYYAVKERKINKVTTESQLVIYSAQPGLPGVMRKKEAQKIARA